MYSKISFTLHILKIDFEFDINKTNLVLLTLYYTVDKKTKMNA